MIDIVFPNGNEDEFIRMAERLGILELIFVYADKSRFYKGEFSGKNALLVDPLRVRNVKDSGVLAVCVGSREAIERRADIAFDFEQMDFKDKTHYRESGLNHVLCEIASKNNVRIAFSFASVLKSSGEQRAVLLGRMAQNIMVCKKYGVDVKIASFAKDPLDMRSPFDLKSFFVRLGMDSAVAGLALD